MARVAAHGSFDTVEVRIRHWLYTSLLLGAHLQVSSRRYGRMPSGGECSPPVIPAR